MSLIGAKNFEPAYITAAEQLRGNEKQWEAFNSSGHCVILAGPGSGKTKTLTIKVAKILSEDVRAPRQVACITYNNQCARELKKRLSRLGIEDGDRISIGTLHSFCLKHVIVPFMHLTDLPKKVPLTIANTFETQLLQQRAIDEVNGGHRKWTSQLDRYRRTYLDRSRPEWRVHDEDAASVIELYEKYLDEKGLIDFDGMVLIGLHLIERYQWVKKAISAKFPVLVVDEYQDLGMALDKIVQKLCFEAGIRLIAVGDPDQSIYGFTGAEPTLLRSLSSRKDVQSIHLKLNYRCGSEIIQASEIALGELRGFKSSRKEKGEVFFHLCKDGIESQAEFICCSIIPDALKRRPGRTIGDIAILYQDKNDGNIIAEAASRAGFQYIRIDGNNPYQQSPITYWLEDCASWCAGGWKLGEPKLSHLIRRWLVFNDSIRSELDRRVLKGDLVRFMYENRNPNLSLNEWLNELPPV